MAVGTGTPPPSLTMPTVGGENAYEFSTDLHKHTMACLHTRTDTRIKKFKYVLL